VEGAKKKNRRNAKSRRGPANFEIAPFCAHQGDSKRLRLRI
jgi:hypothetical protein